MKAKNTESLLKKYQIKPNLSKDQFFLVNAEVIKELADIAQITKEDRVLEIGAGLGFLTRELASRAKEVITIEIDKKFAPILKDLPDNVRVIYDDAYRLLNNKNLRAEIKPPTKIVANIPYSQAQNMLHNYTNSSWYQGDLIWLAPTSLADKVNNEAILGAYFTAKVIRTVLKSAFYPQPNTSSAIIYFKRVADPQKTKNFMIYFRRWLYSHENWKLKNALREGIIEAAGDLKGIRITKNKAKELILKLEIPDKELNKLTNNIRPEYYFEIPQKLEDWFGSLNSNK